ncbi:hypothetical protein BDR22DRAFT_973144 [Usnea florida]
MAADTEFHSQSETTHPCLLTLPDELKLKILSNFYDDDSDPSNALTLMVLRRTHKSLRQLIPNPWKEARPTAEHYTLAERQYPYLFPFSCRLPSSCNSDRCSEPCFLFFPCYDCLRVLNWGYCDGFTDDIPHNDNFKNYEIAYSREKGQRYWFTDGDSPGTAGCNTLLVTTQEYVDRLDRHILQSASMWRHKSGTGLAATARSLKANSKERLELNNILTHTPLSLNNIRYIVPLNDILEIASPGLGM